MSKVGPDRRSRVLFVAEAATLAHVARSLVLAQSLDSARYDVRFACASGFDWVFAGSGIEPEPIWSVSSEAFLKALAEGKPLYDDDTLERYLREDLRILDQVAPDLVVGDFRLSLAVSARLCDVPYATITNAYWSPYARVRYPLPDIPLAKALGVPVAQRLFDLVRPLVFSLHAAPINRLRRRHGMAPLGSLPSAYTSADYTFYADLPTLAKMKELPSNHHFLGPILWSPPVQKPDWWGELPSRRPTVYLNLGSSGQAGILPTIVDALAGFDVNVMVATAGRTSLGRLPNGVWSADFLPGDEAARLADLVICNGGSPSVYQAVAESTPVLGVPSNMDQYLSMNAAVRAGLGKVVRSSQATKESIGDAVSLMLNEPAYRMRAEQIAREIADNPAPARFSDLVGSIASTSATSRTERQLLAARGASRAA